MVGLVEFKASALGVDILSLKTKNMALPKVTATNIHINLDVHESMHRDITKKVTNKTQPYRLIYYS
jgi:hypothetical protein